MSRTCALCEAPIYKKGTRCLECIKAARRSLQRICTDCGSSFTGQVNGARVCGPCDYKRSRKPCADCGHPVARRATVCVPCSGKRRSGTAASRWAGGRRRINGYVQVRMPGHPNAQRTGYVLEHILVMATLLGRPLLPNENVHHRNGVRDDNRPENLELWVKSQPSGQRVTDLLDWARTIVARYDPVEHLIREENDEVVAAPVLPLFGGDAR